MLPSSAAAEISLRYGVHGPSSVVSTGCTSGIDAIGYAFQIIKNGEADVMFARAADAPISPITVACFDAIRATTIGGPDPEQASTPFDATRAGFVLGEGSAVLVVQELERAIARGAHTYCEARGYDNRANAFHMTGLRPDGYELGEAIMSAMLEAGVRPDEFDYISAHGSGTAQNDRHETAAYNTPSAPTRTRWPSAPSSPSSDTRSTLSAPWRWPPAPSPSTVGSSRPPPTSSTRTRSATSTTPRSSNATASGWPPGGSGRPGCVRRWWWPAAPAASTARWCSGRWARACLTNPACPATGLSDRAQGAVNRSLAPHGIRGGPDFSFVTRPRALSCQTIWVRPRACRVPNSASPGAGRAQKASAAAPNVATATAFFSTGSFSREGCSKGGRRKDCSSDGPTVDAGQFLLTQVASCAKKDAIGVRLTGLPHTLASVVTGT